METHFVPKSSRTNTPFSTYQMIGIAEGFEECNNHEVQIEAWHRLGRRDSIRGFRVSLVEPYNVSLMKKSYLMTLLSIGI